METEMSNKVRNTAGKFALKSEVPRKVRSVNLTDASWQWLAAVADKLGMSRNDYLEALAESSISFMETAELQSQPFMEMAEPHLEEDASITQQLNTEVSSLMETVQAEIEFLEQQSQSQSRRLEEQDQELLKLQERNGDLERSVQNLREQLEKERASREEIEVELSEKNQNSAPIAIELPEAADLLNQLKARRKKPSASLADVEKILEILEEGKNG